MTKEKLINLLDKFKDDKTEIVIRHYDDIECSIDEFCLECILYVLVAIISLQVVST